MAVLFARQYCAYDEDCNFNSPWWVWGRWVLFGVLVVTAILLFICCSCYTARRRRRMGYQPYRGTGWAVNNGPWGYNNTQQPYYNNSAPPGYPQPGQPQQENSYYGNQGVELQQPGPTYGGQPVYGKN